MKNINKKNSHINHVLRKKYKLKLTSSHNKEHILSIENKNIFKIEIINIAKIETVFLLSIYHNNIKKEYLMGIYDFFVFKDIKKYDKIEITVFEPACLNVIIFTKEFK